jgi:glutathione synthase/RimK-type ligase-like ATP-grasp enzyme
MRTVLGARAIGVLEEIARVLDLDYGGVDFGIDAGGNVVIFEANATMAVYPPMGDLYAYRRPAFDAVINAVRAMITGRATT